MDLLSDIHDDYVKQGVHLPAIFSLYNEKSRTKEKVELYEDMQLSNMWGGFKG